MKISMRNGLIIVALVTGLVIEALKHVAPEIGPDINANGLSKKEQMESYNPFSVHPLNHQANNQTRSQSQSTNLLQRIREFPRAVGQMIAPVAARVFNVVEKGGEGSHTPTSNTASTDDQNASVNSNGDAVKNGENPEEQTKIVDEDGDEIEEVFDEETGQIVKRKKKKEGESEEKTPEQIAAEDAEKNKNQEPKEESTKSEELQPPEFNYTGGFAGGGNTSKPPANDPAASFDEWVRRLMSRPNFKETSAFIDAFKSHQINADVFYKIVNMMLNDSRFEIQEMGLLAAGSTPSLDSFHAIVALMKKNSINAPIRQKADQYLNRYADPVNLQVLAQVLSSSDSVFATIIALQKLELSSQILLSRSPDAQPGQTPQTTQLSEEAAAPYHQFLGILQTLVQSPGDVVVTDQARSTLARLQSILGVNPAQPPSGTPTGPGNTNSPPTQAS